MKPRTTLVIIAATAALFFGGLGVVILVGRGLQALRSGMSNETARQAFVTWWQPPARMETALVFPPQIGGRRAGEAQPLPSPKFPNLPLTGYVVAYGKPGTPDIEVLVARANSLEVEAIQRRTRDDFDKRGGTKSFVEVPGRLRLSSSSPAETVEVWSLKDWLFIYRFAGELEAEFIRMHLASISTAAPPDSSPAPAR